jgi:hypothetical protein
MKIRDQYFLWKQSGGKSKEDSKRGQRLSIVTSISAFIISIMTFISQFLAHDQVELVISSPSQQLVYTDQGRYLKNVTLSFALTALNLGNRSASIISAVPTFVPNGTLNCNGREDEFSGGAYTLRLPDDDLYRFGPVGSGPSKVIAQVIEAGKMVTLSLEYNLFPGDIRKDFPSSPPHEQIVLDLKGTVCLKIQIVDSLSEIHLVELLVSHSKVNIVMYPDTGIEQAGFEGDFPPLQRISPFNFHRFISPY